MAAAGIAASLALAALTACETPPTHTSKPTPQATPLFATDAEALAAATKAYAAYLKVSDAIAHDGGAHPERIKPLVTSRQLDSQAKDFEDFEANGYVSRGSTTFDSMKLQKMSSSPAGTEIGVYVCIDVSGVRLVDSSGKDKTPAGRPNRLPLEVLFQSTKANVSQLLVDKSGVWSGKNFC
jgi:hypothetical protein